MLPDLRIVIVAVLSTFVLTVGVGFFASSRLIGEPNKRTDTLASIEDSPINRIALSWPEPTQRPDDQAALDFAVTTRALRNPVRDVTNETVPVVETPPAAKEPPVRTSATAPVAAPMPATPAKSEPAPAAPAVSAAVAPVVSAPVPEPDIRIAVQYPPISELPPELQTPPSAPAPAEQPAIAAVPQPEAPVTTGSIVDSPAAPERTDEPGSKKSASDDTKDAQPDLKAAAPKVASRPDDADAVKADNAKAEKAEPKKPAPKAAAKPARKKAAPKKTAKPAKRPVRRVAPRAAAAGTAGFPLNFFNLPN